MRKIIVMPKRDRVAIAICASALFSYSSFAGTALVDFARTCSRFCESIASSAMVLHRR